MMDADDTKLEQVVRKTHPDATVLRTWRLAGGISSSMTAFEMAWPDGRSEKLILRQPGEHTLRYNADAASDEFKLLQFLHARGLPVPLPRWLDTSCEILPESYLVIAFIDAEPDFRADLPDQMAAQLATHLAAIHDIGTDPALPFLRKRGDRLTRYFANPPAPRDPALDETRMRETLAAASPFPRPQEHTLLHGDFWPGNVLWRNDRLVAVVDWEDSETGDPLADVAISRLEIRWIAGPQASAAFTRHYQALTGIDLTDLPYWDLLAALRCAGDLASWSSDWACLGRPDITEQTMTEDRNQFVAEAFAALVADG